MMKDVWVKDSGIKKETEAAAFIEQNAAGYEMFIALCTDRMVCAKAEHIKTVTDDIAHLLDLRLFNSDSELHMVRTMMGADFTWRIADDRIIAENVKDKGDFFNNPENYMLPVTQKLDIDGNRTPEQNSKFGGRMLRTTGGGIYELPVEKDTDAVELVNYIRYDDNGTANIVDFRIKGFTKKG